MHIKDTTEVPYFPKTFVEAVREKLIFLIGFFRNPVAMGSIFPSSFALTNKLVRPIKTSSDPIGRRYLEVGAGTGAVTESMVKKLSKIDHLDVVEIDPTLCDILRKKFGQYQNVKIIQASVLALEETPYDGIISSLPFNQFDAQFVQQVFDKYKKMMKESAFLTYYEYKYPRFLAKFFLERNQRLEQIRSLKKQVGVSLKEKKESVWFNLPPANVRFLTNKETNSL
jgi:phosphatidylethanolamine/phosphatidyl-N-methylethanolamine N-methyltransferase